MQQKPDDLIENDDQPDRWGERLPRQVGLVNAVAVLVGVTIGSGIFRVPATVAAQLHDPGPAILCWILGGVIALFGALTIAELSGALPRSGGIFAYLLESFGPLPAFMFGWTELAVVRASALGATATIFAERFSSRRLTAFCRAAVSESSAITRGTARGPRRARFIRSPRASSGTTSRIP